MNDKTKSKSKDTSSSEFSIEVQLPNQQYARFIYSSLELADGHYTALQAQQVVGGYGIKSLTKSWRK